MDKDSKIYIAGHKGMVGSAILRNLKSKGYKNFFLASHTKYDLINQKTVSGFFKKELPEYVIDAAAKVGGIMANNTYRAQFIYDNLMIQNNLIHTAYKFWVKKLLFIGSSCIYPRNCPQPMKEEYLLTGELEPTNEPYAIAKIAGIKMCENYYRQNGCNFISVMPSNLYGENDNFNLETSHVIPALIRKFHLAKCLKNDDWDLIRKDLNKYPINRIDGSSDKSSILEVLRNHGIKFSNRNYQISIEVWGSGIAMREFLYVDDCADAIIYLMENLNANDLQNMGISHINIGNGQEISISDLVKLVSKIVEYNGKIIFDKSKPDGMLQKVLDVSRLHSLGWKYKTELETGIRKSYEWYIHNITGTDR